MNTILSFFYITSLTILIILVVKETYSSCKYHLHEEEIYSAIVRVNTNSVIEREDVEMDVERIFKREYELLCELPPHDDCYEKIVEVERESVRRRWEKLESLMIGDLIEAPFASSRRIPYMSAERRRI